MTRAALVRRLCVGAFLAAGVVCALEGLPDAADADAGDQAAPAPAEAAPNARANPDGGAGVLGRRRARHWKRLGLPIPEGGGWNVPRDAGAPRDAVAVPRGAPVTAPPTTAPPAPAAPPATAAPAAPPVTDLGFNSCQKIPRGKRVVKMNLKPDIELTELIAWISSITCQSFVLPGHLSGGGKKVTIVSQGLMTRDEAFAAFLTALDTLGLTVERGPGYMKIIETAKAKTSSTPVYGFDGQPTSGK